MRLETPKGFRDFLPLAALKRRFVLQKIIKVFTLFGFDPLETPAIEFAETLKGKYGEEEKLIYEFTDRGGRQVALRYDQTVPLARVVAQYPQLPKPFKRYQIQNVWRAENPQKGRFREFLQVDFDIVGSSSLLADAEVVQIIASVLKELGFEKFRILVNSRTLLKELVSKAGIDQDKISGAISSIDKLKKIGREGVLDELKDRGINESSAKKLIESFETAKPLADVQGLMNILDEVGIANDRAVFEPTLARGLDYYTGLIFEAEVEGFTAGSVCGGGRYDKLIGLYSGTDVPATGASFGFDRLIEALEEQNLIPKKETNTKVLVTIFNEGLLQESLKAAEFLRKNGISTEIYLDSFAKLDKQLKYADNKGIPNAIIIGPDEAEKNLVTIKNLITQEQKQIPFQKLPSEITSD